MGMIKGITVKYINRVQVGIDDFNRPIYKTLEEDIDNVLVSPVTSDDVINTLDLTGKKAIYTLAVPKGDTHKWEDAEVEFFGERWKVFGKPIIGIEENIPLEWNKKVMVERYE